LYQCTSAGGAPLSFIPHPSTLILSLFRSAAFRCRFTLNRNVKLTISKGLMGIFDRVSLLLKHLRFCSALLVLLTQFLAGSPLIVRRIDAETTSFQRPRCLAANDTNYTNKNQPQINADDADQISVFMFVRVLFREFVVKRSFKTLATKSHEKSANETENKELRITAKYTKRTPNSSKN
jgi:hypothetical protein